MAEQHKVTRQLEIFATRCFELADRVDAGFLEFIDALDMAHSAAMWACLPRAIEDSGLIEYPPLTGIDIVQEIMAAAFADVRRPPS